MPGEAPKRLEIGAKLKLTIAYDCLLRHSCVRFAACWRTAQATGGSQSTAAAASDADKICLQLFLDVKEFGKQLEKLGLQVGAQSTPAYAHLWHTVAPEGQKDAIDLSDTGN